MTTNAWSDLGSFIAGSASPSITIVTTTPTAGQVQDSLLATALRRFYRIIRR